MIRKKDPKILKMEWNPLYKNNGKVLHQLQKNIAKKNSNFRRTKQKRLMLASNCPCCGNKKSRFIKNHKASVLKLHSY